MSENTPAVAGTSGTTPPVTTEGNNAPLDPVILKMLDHHVYCTVWPYVDDDATKLKLEEKKKAEPHLAWQMEHCRVYKRSPTEIAAAQATFKSLKPQDAIEAMLASQAAGVYFASIECLSQASWERNNVENRIAYLNAASKLSRTFAELSKALDRHRGKGCTEQKIIVQYVNVANGGQAVISQGRGAEKIAE